MDKNKILIITGMHRSGSSVVMQWLRKCGLELGNHSHADREQEDRYAQDSDFLEAHTAILKSRRCADTGITTSPLQALSYMQKDRLKDIIRYKNRFNPQWGWGDPRTCLFLDTYQELVPDAFYLVVLRDYQAVVCSLLNDMYKRTEARYAAAGRLAWFIWERLLKKRRMKKLSKKYSQVLVKAWIAYNTAILEHLKALPAGNFIVAEHAMLHRNDRPVFRHLTRAWGFALTFCRFGSLFREKLLNRPFNIDAYVKDASLLSRARHIENELRRLSVIGHPGSVWA